VWRTAVAVAVIAGATACGCSSGSGRGAQDVAQARMEIDQRIAGAWRLASFVPDEPLNPVMTTILAMQNDQLVVVFERGVVRSASPSLTFERSYRIEEPQKAPFRVVLTDEQGVAYDTLCSFDHAGRLHFQSLSPPWKGRGILEREGAGLDAMQ
jgi:hypothetical protein